jgi:hypothetical protein
MWRRVSKGFAKRGTVLAAVVAVTICGAVSAFAATLNVGASGLSAGNAVVASCRQSGTPITANYTAAYDSTVDGYKVTGVTVTGMDPHCDGKTIDVTVTGAANAVLASGTETYDAAGSNTSIVFASLSATPKVAEVTGISVAING